ncbi:MAG: hypothetical protein HZY74_13470 [Brevundimonas sp.]|nr:MAG: hypothetical protein HZY74_13470 [Brevundimonas sp.]
MNQALWVHTADRIMKRDWCIGTADAGVSPEQLERAWRDGETPEAFVTWFAQKYDLIRFDPNPYRPSKA